MTTELLQKAKDFILKNINAKPEIGILLGSGLQSVYQPMKITASFQYSQIPGFVNPTVSGHKGNLLIGKWKNRDIAILQGRLHFYEGLSLDEITFPIRLLKELNVKILILTSAVGGMNKKFKVGDLGIVYDHINFTGQNPLRNSAFNGEKFIDMSEAYSPRLIKIFYNIAKKLKIPIHKVVYIGLTGPSYETPAEIKAFRKLGADVVGMSVVNEVIVSNQLNLETACLIYISNMASGVLKKSLSHKEVLEIGNRTAPKITQIFERVIPIL